jgi:hypothetical protein
MRAPEHESGGRATNVLWRVVHAAAWAVLLLALTRGVYVVFVA